MTHLPAGTELDVLTGLGNGYDTSLAGERPLLVGGGRRHPAPVRTGPAGLTAEHRQVTAVLGYNRASDIFLAEELHALGVTVRLLTADGSAGPAASSPMAWRAWITPTSIPAGRRPCSTPCGSAAAPMAVQL